MTRFSLKDGDPIPVGELQPGDEIVIRTKNGALWPAVTCALLCGAIYLGFRNEWRRQEDAARCSAIAPTIHVVVAGESLWSIAADELGDGARWRELAERNGISDPRRLAVGQEIEIP